MTIHYTYECDVCHKNYDKEELVKLDRDGNNHICRYCMKVKIWDYSKKVYGTGINDLDINTVKWMYISLKNIVSAIGDNAIIMEPSSSQMDNIIKECQPMMVLYRYAVDFHTISELMDFVIRYCKEGMYRIKVGYGKNGSPQLMIDIPNSDISKYHNAKKFRYMGSYAIKKGCI